MQYITIKEGVANLIDRGELTANKKLPTERALAEQFQTTRVTLREALTTLEAEGMIHREDRRGWFVSPPSMIYDPTSTNNFNVMASKCGFVPSSKLIQAKQVSASQEVAALLNVPVGTQVYRIDRLRMLDGRPVVVTFNYVIMENFPSLLEHDIESSLTDVYREQYQKPYAKTHFQIKTSSLLGETAQLLRASTGSPAMLVQRVNYCAKGVLLDCDIEFWRPHAIKIQSTASVLNDTE